MKSPVSVLAALLENLPENWGDKIRDGELTIRVSAQAVDDALEILSEKPTGFRMNPAPRRNEIQRAAKLYKDFTGHIVTKAAQVALPGLPTVGLAIGPCLGIMYSTVRDGKREKYLHQFRKGSQPLVVVGSDGDSVLLLGGAFTFTNRGFEDR